MFKTLTLAAVIAVAFAEDEEVVESVDFQMLEDLGSCSDADDALAVSLEPVEDYCSSCESVVWDEDLSQCCLKDRQWALSEVCEEDDCADAKAACEDIELTGVANCVVEDAEKAAECAFASGLFTNAAALLAAAVVATL